MYSSTENNPKFFETLLRQAKAYKSSGKASENFIPEKYAQGKMPKEASSNNDFTLTYLNGHFGYYQKTMIITNGIGVLQDIQFPDEIQEFCDNKMPQIVKDEYDSKVLIPSLEFFSKQSYNNFNYFLGDSGFDGYDNYKYISKKGIIPIIPLNKRNGSLNANCFRYSKDNLDNDFYFNSKGFLICRKTNLPMKPLAQLIVKIELIGFHGRKVNIAIDEEYRFNTSLPRNTKKWQNLYKTRTVCERAIGQLKDYLNINSSQIRNTVSLKSTILLAGITQLIGVLIMIRSGHIDHLRAFKTVA